MKLTKLINGLSASRESLLGVSAREANKALLVTAFLLALFSFRLVKGLQIPGVGNGLIDGERNGLLILALVQCGFLAMFVVNVVSDMERVLGTQILQAHEALAKRYVRLADNLSNKIKQSALSAEQEAAAAKAFTEHSGHLRKLRDQTASQIENLTEIGERGSRFSRFAADMRIQRDRLVEADDALKKLEAVGPKVVVKELDELERLKQELRVKEDEALAFEKEFEQNRTLKRARKLQVILDITLGPSVVVLSWIAYFVSRRS